MADVFLVGVYVAFLSAKATDNLDASLEIGFYYFAAYCVVSILSHQVMDHSKTRLPSSETDTTRLRSPNLFWRGSRTRPPRSESISGRALRQLA